MTAKNKLFSIFKKSSTTYFFSSLFFPAEVRMDVTRLYAFVRVVDDYVDHVPQKKKEFYAFWDQYKTKNYTSHSTNEIILQHFSVLMEKYHITPIWTDDFLKTMEKDLTKKKYHTLQETEDYMYGSAEVIGLMMAKITGLPSASYSAAQKLGKAMQYINFIRDIQEDNTMGQQYLPADEIKKYGLPDLSSEAAKKYPHQWEEFVHAQLGHYRIWQKEAEKGFRYIPRRYLIAIKTASDMYIWTANQIEKNPFIVFKKKVKPSPFRIFATALKNSIL